MKWLVALAICLVWASPAQARWHCHHHWRHHHHRWHHRHHRARAARRELWVRINPPPADPIAAAYALAVRYWGATPCAGQVSINAAEGSWEEAMRTEWDLGTSYADQESAPQPFSGCVLTINSVNWPSTTYEATDAWAAFVTVMTHEVGHLLGHEHSPDPYSVMYPVLQDNYLPLAFTGAHAPGWR